MPKIVRPGEIIGGVAPDDGFLVRVTPQEILSGTFGEAMLDWIRCVLMCRFPGGAQIRIQIDISDFLTRTRPQ
jgi:hypothetical protein